MSRSIRTTVALALAASLSFATPTPSLAATSHLTIHNETAAPVSVTVFEAWSGRGIAPNADGGPVLTTSCLAPHASYSQGFSERIGSVRFEVRHAGCAMPAIHAETHKFSVLSGSQTFTIHESGGHYTVR